MLDQAIAVRVNQAIAEEFELDGADLKPETRLGEDLGLDSLDGVDLIAAMERTFKVKVPESEARKLRTIADVHGFIERLLAAAPQAAQA